MNLANKLTVSRFFLTFCFIYFLYIPSPYAKLAAIAFFALASITDYLDGMIAKRYNMETDFGRLMDPIADKVLVLSAFLVFIELGILPAWMVLIIIFRELLITGMRLVRLRQKEVVAASKAGKHKTVSQIIVISAALIFLAIQDFALLKGFSWWNDRVAYLLVKFIHSLMLVAIFFTIFSGISYLKNNLRLFKKI